MEQAVMMKDRGNACYKKQKFSAAIDCYTEAICLCSTVAAFYTNRALCYLQLERYPQAQDDCTRATQLDSANAKAYYLLGKACVGAAEYSRGIQAFEMSIEKAQGSATPATFVEDVLQQLRRAKKLKWNEVQRVRGQRHGRVKSLVAGMLDSSRQSCLRTGDDHAVIHEEHDLVLAHMMELLETSPHAPHQRKIPEYFLCPIGMDIMLDPVSTPNGVSYERKWIEQHLDVQAIDPLTREKLTRAQLRPNVGLRHAIEDFLHENPWAYEDE
ncbi:hypothetical protein SDRG_09632 [Saprolegnia diclina VS20]|uniref:E3 ubiquitin-protein ligase CHIP n=1 Tax=Saprolegnia diclina (strain VS20) TaxID=1156394 RepID=T0QD43_SAPDV|nr:hypothetical protein SDRG_09632 [Saprolegnia diclina VS20]EQC32656.1 hypothetical protein SDRG_09632 [Saprolegnia diclina VS20]|eukprot:XP_008613800.1 hypothetical protein SDRG_09632 [Saprolegnia diclina VS20]